MMGEKERILFRTFSRSEHVEIFVNEKIKEDYVLVSIKAEPDVGYYVLMQLPNEHGNLMKGIELR